MALVVIIIDNTIAKKKEKKVLYKELTTEHAHQLCITQIFFFRSHKNENMLKKM